MEFTRNKPKASTQRFKKITQKLGIQAQTKEERFEDGMKEFYNVNTFFTITDLLKGMNKDQPTPERQALFESQQKLIKAKLKLKKWKSEFPEYLTLDQKPQQVEIKQKTQLLQRAKTYLDLQKQEPELCNTMNNLTNVLKEKFKKIDMKEYPQLELFKEISQYEELRIRTELTQSIRDSYNHERGSLKLDGLEDKPNMSYDAYFKNYHGHADQLRSRLREQQMSFFNAKWGNSVVKMKMKEAQDKRGFLEKAKQLRRAAVTKKVALPYLAPVIKNIITDICTEEADMMEQKKAIKKEILELEKIGTAFFQPKPAPVIMGLRIMYS